MALLFASRTSASRTCAEPATTPLNEGPLLLVTWDAAPAWTLEAGGSTEPGTMQMRTRYSVDATTAASYTFRVPSDPALPPAEAATIRINSRVGCASG